MNEISNTENNDWSCLDKDGIVIGHVYGVDEHDVIKNYVNCAIGASSFDRPVWILMRGDMRLDVTDFVIFLRVKKLPKGPLIGMINPNKIKVDQDQPKSVEEIISIIETSFPGEYEVVNKPSSR